MLTRDEVREVIEATLGYFEMAVESRNPNVKLTARPSNENLTIKDFSSVAREYGALLSERELEEFNSRYRKIIGVSD